MTADIDENDEEVAKRAVAAVKLDLEKKKILNAPIYVYDRKDKKVYQLKEDGTRVAVADRIRKGSYCEQCKNKA